MYKTTEEALEERRDEGFKGGTTSTDGTMVLGDRGRPNDPCCTDPPTLPGYLDTEDYPDWPNMEEDKALAIVRTYANTIGGSEGFNPPIIR